LDRVEECLLALGVFIKLFNFLEFVQQVLVEDVPHYLVRVVSDQRWLNKVLSVINRVDKLEGIQKSSLHIDLLDQGLLVHLELDPTLLIKLVQLVKAEAVETGFW
jgi:hypothetical protein|tara:strand:- start:7 stop:321 length:315 start_codon:yes stop_codon:yes gene_type:complete